MTEAEAKDLLVNVVTEVQGLKATELAARLELLELHKADLNIVELIEALVKEKRLVEVEYVLPQMDFRIKSFLLPAQTRVRCFNESSIS